jgi:putative transposase
MKKDYLSDLSDKEWELIHEFYKNKYHRQGCPPSKNLRKQWNGIMYLLRSGCSWRMLPKEFGVWKTVYKQFFILKKQRKIRGNHAQIT